MKRAIIAGATGAIGTALINNLIEHGIEVLVLVRPESSRRNNIPESKYVCVMECGMKDYASTMNTTGKEYDVFYHFAWAGASGPGRNDMYLQTDNIKYALDAVGMAKRFGCKKFIGAGSQAEYGRFEGLLKPDTPTFPEMGYGYAKLCAGLMTRDYANQIGLEHVWVRILSVYGPNDGSQSMVMSTINKLLNGDIPQFTKGEQMWDYLHSSDAAEAFRLIADKGISNKVYVLGNGRAFPLAQYIKSIRDIVNPGCNIELGAIPYSPKQVMHLQADISELERDCSWKPVVEFEDGIRSILNSFMKQNNGR
mgnify:CR=1 FL=1